MNILMLIDGIPPQTLGGAGRIVVETAKGLAARGHNVTVSAPEHPDNPTLIDGIIPVRSIPRSPKRFAHYRSIWSRRQKSHVMDVIRSVQPDLIHAHVIAWHHGYRWIKAASALRIPIVVTCHDVVNIADGRVRPNEPHLWWKDLKRSRWEWNPFRAPLVRSLFNAYCTVICVSTALRTFYEAHGYKKIRTFHNGIDCAVWSPSNQASARKELALPPDRFCFFIAGRLGIDKGTDLIRTILPNNADLLVAGSFARSDFPNDGRVHFFSNQSAEQMRKLYAASDAVLIPSLCLDSFPTTCLESQACARAVLASSWGGAKEAVIDGKTGWILDPLDHQAWKEKMEWCAGNRDKLEPMGKDARSHMIKEFPMERHIEELEEIYEEARKAL